MVQNRQSWILDSCQHCLFLTFYAEEAVCKCSPVGILVGWGWGVGYEHLSRCVEGIIFFTK